MSYISLKFKKKIFYICYLFFQLLHLQVLWTYKYDLTHSSQVEDLARGYCKDDINVFNECSSGEGGYGNTISCLIQNLNKVEVRFFYFVFQSFVLRDFSIKCRIRFEIM